MAKKKTAGTGPIPTPADGAPDPRKRGASRRSATSSAMDRSPAAEGSSTTTEEMQLAGATAAPRVSHPSYDEIARVAYERYLQRGRADGRDFDDWLAAERELRERSRA